LATVLLIDDDVDLVEMNRAVLVHRGHQVLAAYSAAETRGLLAGVRPDIIVLDVMMESPTAGFDLAREIHQGDPSLPMIILSGVREATGLPFRFEPDETWLPVVKFLEKPVSPAVLASEIEAVLRREE
jgi:DNA-binding response OmpR family regulator